MKKCAYASIFAFLIISLCWTNFLTAGQIAPELSGKISGKNGADKISVVIAVNNSLPASILKKELNEKYSTNSERHRSGMTRLKGIAGQSQSDLLGSLNAMKNIGLADNIKSHWLINVITADITMSELTALAARNDVAEIFEIPKVELIEPEQELPSLAKPATPGGVESNIILIGAPAAWAKGYTGKGRIICSFDTGIEGNHPALHDSWKGLDGDSSAAWFDPIGKLPYPHTFGSYGSKTNTHGSHTMGIMLGHDDVTGDTIGVAPDAKWISAAVIDILGASIIDGFEWAADPDGNPNTIDDVPDVINHSWGINNSTIGCNDYFWEMLDNTEALGIVNIFAAGNSGPTAYTIANPANRAYDSLDCFAIGSITGSSRVISSYSSHGPSDCDSQTIKPNLVAPGDYIRSSIPAGGYSNMSGTSMAAPHVSGAVAILREAFPNATVDEIKEALIKSTQRLGDPSPNNTYGWGLINIGAAIDSLMPKYNTDLRIYSFDYPLLEPGGTVSGTVYLKNFGHQLSYVYATVTNSSPSLAILTNNLSFGTIGLDGIKASNIPFQAVINDSVTPGTILTVDLLLHGSGGYSRNAKLYIQVGQVPMAGYYTHRNSRFQFTISNYGQFGLAPGSMVPLGFAGFKYIDTMKNDIWEAALMIGTDTGHVSDGARNIVEEPDNDFAISPGGDIQVFTPGPNADQETFSIFNDSKAERPIGLEISQRSYSWNDPADESYVILEYVFQNNTDSSINDLYFGCFFDWDIYDISNYSSNKGGYSAAEKLGYMYAYYGGNPPSKFRGISIINPEGTASFRLRRNPLSGPSLYYSGDEKFANLSSGIFTNDSLGDFAEIISTGPFNLGPGTSDTAIFAIIGAGNLADLQGNAVRAANRYFDATDIVSDNDGMLPASFQLGQNFPNPFNPGTTISFGLEKRQKIGLSIYNILGENVAELVNRELPAGNYNINWDGRDKTGKICSSGIYLYRLSSGEKALCKKMLLMK
jgi:subtilisin family serine protease